MPSATLMSHPRDVYANNPNSYINHIRDNGFVDRYDVDRREAAQYAALIATVRHGSDDPDGDAGGCTDPALPLSSFYNRAERARLAGRRADGRRAERQAGGLRQGEPGVWPKRRRTGSPRSPR